MRDVSQCCTYCGEPAVVRALYPPEIAHGQIIGRGAIQRACPQHQAALPKGHVKLTRLASPSVATAPGSEEEVS